MSTVGDSSSRQQPSSIIDSNDLEDPAMACGATRKLESKLDVVQTEALGFLPLAGRVGIILAERWDPLPLPTASLLCIASKTGLVAAAGPSGVSIATTDSIRNGFEGPQEGFSHLRTLEPQLKIPLLMRISQLAFTADESYLVLSAESDEGLIAYEVRSLLQGELEPALKIATNGEIPLAIVPNPTPQMAELCAVVTEDGSLYVANLKERFLSASLHVMGEVNCVSWSSEGTQLVAGLADGTIKQMTAGGESTAVIPEPPELENHYVSTVAWLESHLFLSVYTSIGEDPESVCYIITRQSPTTFSFRQLPWPVDPYRDEDSPYLSIQRLKDFPPNLQDLLIVGSQATPDMGVISRSKTSLSIYSNEESTANVFTTTEIDDDDRRISLPLSQTMDFSVAIGTALDLSARGTVRNPTEETEESPGPVPGYWVLTNDGIIYAWWVIYSESITDGTAYPGLTFLDVVKPNR